MKKKLLMFGLPILFFAIFVLVARNITSEVRVERTFKAPRSQVWQLWTNAETIAKWWGPKDFSAPVIKSDFQVGGAFLLSMKSASGEMFWNTGKYTEIVPQEKIVSTLSFADENGARLTGQDIPVPGVWPDEVTVTVLFQEKDGGTLVTVIESGIPLIMKLFAGLGWSQQFDKIEELLK